MMGMLRVLFAIFGCVVCSVTTFAGGPFYSQCSKPIS